MGAKKNQRQREKEKEKKKTDIATKSFNSPVKTAQTEEDKENKLDFVEENR